METEESLALLQRLFSIWKVMILESFFSLEEYFDKDACDYYEALQSVEKKDGDLTHWLEYFTSWTCKRACKN